MQHVLPKGFRRVRDYGFLHSNAKKLLSLVKRFCYEKVPEEAEEGPAAGIHQIKFLNCRTTPLLTAPTRLLRCSQCGQDRGAIVDAGESGDKQRKKDGEKAMCGEVLWKDVKWAQAI